MSDIYIHEEGKKKFKLIFSEHLITAIDLEGLGVDMDMRYFMKIKKVLTSMTFIKSAEPAYGFLLSFHSFS